MSTAGTITRRTPLTGTDNPAFQVSKDVFNDSLIIASAAADGAVLVRDATQTDGWGFEAGVLLTAAGAIKTADGTAALPAYSFATEPTLGFWRSAAAATTHQGSLAVTGNITGSLNVTVGAANALTWNARAAIYSPANGQVNMNVQNSSAGVGFDVVTDAILKVRTRAQTAYATVDALGYRASGAAGVNFGPAAVTSITIVGGIVTACS